MRGLSEQLEVLHRHRGGHDLHLARIPDRIAQTHLTSKLAGLAGLRQHLTTFDFDIALDYRLGIGGKVVDIPSKHPKSP